MISSRCRALSSYNRLLREFAENLLRNYPKMKVALFDTQSFFTTLLDSPERYGFKKWEQYCEGYGWATDNPNDNKESCGAPFEEYVWYNGYQ